MFWENWKFKEKVYKITWFINRMEIQIYTTPTCPWCKKLKVWLKKKKLEYEEKDISESQNKLNRDEILDKSGQMAVPVIDIDGKIIVGFDEEKILKVLS